MVKFTLGIYTTGNPSLIIGKNPMGIDLAMIEERHFC